jgi:glycerol-1-phosphate dehydrogenase [NAD(P)+]
MHLELTAHLENTAHPENTAYRERRSLPSALPYAVIVDTQVCSTAPVELWHSGVGDLTAKLTAIADWKLAFHQRGTPINDLAALLSDATVMQFIARPERDLEGLRLLATALLLNGIAIQIAGSSRPASGSEHLISHALDKVSARPRLHGLQVGVATYLVSLLQRGVHSERIAKLFADTGFWETIRRDPFDRDEWLTAIKLAPSIKKAFYSVLTHRDCVADATRYLSDDPWLRICFH